MEGGEMNSQSGDTNAPSQSIEDIMSILQEARRPAEGLKLGGHILSESVDLDDMDADADLEDVETSGDFVCAL